MCELYLAYGSNLNLKQMAHRCPTAKLVATTFLKDYKMLFRGRHGGAVATVEPCKDSEVPVAIWEIQPQDQLSLDIYEGYPNLYDKKYLKVKINNKPTKVMAYIMNEGKPIGIPSLYYYNVIKDGYSDCDFDESYLKQALKNSGVEI